MEVLNTVGTLKMGVGMGMGMKVIEGDLLGLGDMHANMCLLMRRREPALLCNYFGCGLTHKVRRILMEDDLLWMDVLHVSMMNQRGIGKFDSMLVSLSLGHFHRGKLRYNLRILTSEDDMLFFYLVILSHFLQIAFLGDFFLPIRNVPQVGSDSRVQVEHPNSLAIIVLLGVRRSPSLWLEGTGWSRGAIVVDAGKTAGFFEMPAGEDVQRGHFFHFDFKYRSDLLQIGESYQRIKANQKQQQSQRVQLGSIGLKKLKATQQMSIFITKFLLLSNFQPINTIIQQL